jgi:hypothetical protein
MLRPGAGVVRTVRACQGRDEVACWTLTSSNHADVRFRAFESVVSIAANASAVIEICHHTAIVVALRLSSWQFTELGLMTLKRLSNARTKFYSRELFGC